MRPEGLAKLKLLGFQHKGYLRDTFQKTSSHVKQKVSMSGKDKVKKYIFFFSLFRKFFFEKNNISRHTTNNRDSTDEDRKSIENTIHSHLRSIEGSIRVKNFFFLSPPFPALPLLEERSNAPRELRQVETAGIPAQRVPPKHFPENRQPRERQRSSEYAISADKVNLYNRDQHRERPPSPGK